MHKKRETAIDWNVIFGRDLSISIEKYHGSISRKRRFFGSTIYIFFKIHCFDKNPLCCQNERDKCVGSNGFSARKSVFSLSLTRKGSLSTGTRLQICCISCSLHSTNDLKRYTFILGRKSFAYYRVVAAETELWKNVLEHEVSKHAPVSPISQ